MPDCLEMPYKPKILDGTDPVHGKANIQNRRELMPVR